MASNNNQTVMRLIQEAWTGRNVDLVDELVSEDYVEHASFGELQGIQAYKEGIHMFTTAFPDIQIEVDEMVAQGDTVAFRITVTGTHQGPFMGVEGSGNKVRFTGFDFTRLHNGKVVEEWFGVDLAGLMEQLQATPVALAT